MVNKVEYENKKIGEEALDKAIKTSDDPTAELTAAKAALKTSIVEALKEMDANKKDDGDKIFNAIIKDKTENTKFIREAKEVIDKVKEFLGKSPDNARKELEAFKTYVNERNDAKTAVNKALKHSKKGNRGYVDVALEHGKEANVELSESVTKAGLDKVTSSADAKTKTDAYKDSDDYKKLSKDNQTLINDRVIP